MTVLLVVDRIEEGIAVLLPQDGGTGEIKCPASLLPPVKEGDVLRASFEPDPDETQKCRDEAQKLLRELLGE
ncbi:MAG: DUF3006 domain-containing protein [Acidaminococcales bacterium]|jgi:hypothetical protein|nr:DUF3006 domain-containing protein [Acidaminococcales bacterium]